MLPAAACAKKQAASAGRPAGAHARPRAKKHSRARSRQQQQAHPEIEAAPAPACSSRRREQQQQGRGSSAAAHSSPSRIRLLAAAQHSSSTAHIYIDIYLFKGNAHGPERVRRVATRNEFVQYNLALINMKTLGEMHLLLDFILLVILLSVTSTTEPKTNPTLKTFVPFPLFPSEISNAVLSHAVLGYMYSILLTPSTKYSVEEGEDPLQAYQKDLVLDLFNFRPFHANGSEVQFQVSCSDVRTYPPVPADKILNMLYDYEPYSFLQFYRTQTSPVFVIISMHEPFSRFRLYPRQPSLQEGESLMFKHNDNRTSFDATQWHRWMIHIITHEYYPEDNNTAYVTSYGSVHIADFADDPASTKALVIDINCDFNDRQPIEEHERHLTGSRVSQKLVCGTLSHSFTRFSHNGQEEEVIDSYNGSRDGVYIDIGANDGISHSNTYALEKYFNWKGLLIEPLPRLLKHLINHRNEYNNYFINACVYNKTYMSTFMEVVGGTGEFSGVADTWPWYENNAHNNSYVKSMIPCFHIQEVLDAYGLTHVDYMSVDAEGADMLILQGIDWSRFTANIVSVECHDTKSLVMENDMKELFMNKLQYKRMKRKGWDIMFFK